MLGNYEKRYFEDDEKIWLGRYHNLKNILHWHSECELIRIVSGCAEIKIGGELFCANPGDCFFCPAEEMHYIVSKSNSLIDIMIFHRELLQKVTHKYTIASAKLSNPEIIIEKINRMRHIMSHKPRFYGETLENCARDILLDVFNDHELCLRQGKNPVNKQIISKINNEFSSITFDEVVSFSGYTSSHFSKTFKKLTGMTFTDYLNCIKTEHAVLLLQNNTGLNITDVCYACGFTTIRNFNRVFKQITGFAPRNLPNDFATDFNISIYTKDNFNPTSHTSVLL